MKDLKLYPMKKVMPEEKALSILEGLAPFLNRHSGVVFVSDTMVSRLEKFKG